jgi:hypothetical protein
LNLYAFSLTLTFFKPFDEYNRHIVSLHIDLVLKQYADKQKNELN